MILPNHGKIIIIDDEEKDVKSLMNALKKEKMPFLFYSDQGGDDLPENGPIPNVRLVFLDLDLGIGDSFNRKQKVRIVQERIVKLIEPNTPYVLVIWSTHEDTLLNILIEDFSGHFKEYAPIIRCSFDKQETINGGHANPLQIIRDKLKNEFSKFEAFNAFLLWESIVGKSSAEVVNGFTQIFELDDSWNKNLLAFFFRLAEANVGRERISELNDQQKLQLALETITLALTDTVETNIRSEINKLNLAIEENGAIISVDQLIAINSKLHVINSDILEHFLPGNVYLQDFTDDEKVEAIVRDAFDKRKIKAIIDSKPRTIKVDITPVCDYSQSKGYTRFLSGILVDFSYFQNKKSPSKASIYNLCPILEILGNRYYAVFDFRYFKSIPQKYVKKHYRNPEFRFRSQILLDLQAGLSNHINRPGIVTVT